MADPRFIVKDQAGKDVAGDDNLDDSLKFAAVQVGGKIIDTRTHEVVYDGGSGSGIDLDIL